MPSGVSNLSLPEASVLGDALQHGVVKVDLWRLPRGDVVGAERVQAAERLSRRGLLYLTAERQRPGVHCLNEEYVPTARGRGRGRGAP